MRSRCYPEPLQGQAEECLTNEAALPPGVLAELDRRRWEVEKAFDEGKNKLGQRQAWGGASRVAKAAQGQRVALTHNLLLIYEPRLEEQHVVSKAAEDRRRARRIAKLKGVAAQSGPGGLDAAGPRPAGEPALGEVHPGVAPRAARKPHGSRRRAPPHHPLCLTLTPPHWTPLRPRQGGGIVRHHAIRRLPSAAPRRPQCRIAKSCGWRMSSASRSR